MALSEYRVWDRTQRVFHWVNFLAVATLAAIGTVILNADRLGIPDDPGMIALKTVHVYVGRNSRVASGKRGCARQRDSGRS